MACIEHTTPPSSPQAAYRDKKERKEIGEKHYPSSDDTSGIGVASRDENWMEQQVAYDKGENGLPLMAETNLALECSHFLYVKGSGVSVLRKNEVTQIDSGRDCRAADAPSEGPIVCRLPQGPPSPDGSARVSIVEPNPIQIEWNPNKCFVDQQFLWM
ncbi:hypothetical protein HNY73_012746 [Argiope bruennichi]|uniref:Uncharacterized protein n=1 Tax=Argiope bruennichi TaxID=94029 RepID=A0A8T0EXQ3_ARGBR|nr:hypothetical protein HNY73_012746 [Argiope bruennichi]